MNTETCPMRGTSALLQVGHFFFFSPEHLTLAAKGLLHMGPSV